MMSTITEEQRRRAEENRQKALAIKAAKQNQNGNQGGQGLGFYSAQSSSRPSTASSSAAREVGAKPMEIRTSNVTQPLSKPAVKLAVPFNGKPVKGYCSLISRSRFKVDIAYNPQAIAVFKLVPGSEYDPKEKTWNFPIDQHGKLLLAVEPLRPFINVGGLPSYVLQIIRKAQQESQEDIDLSPIDSVLVGSLMPFQKDGVVFGIRKKGRALIADDMGLGKTIQALGIAHYYYKEWPLLIVSPSSMRYQWREAIWSWLPSVSPASVTVTETTKDDIKRSKVVIMSYDNLQRRHEEVENCHFKVVIMDESHQIKNFKAARTKAAVPVLQNATRALLLSGTPALSRPVELFPQLSALARNFMTMNEYGMRYCDGKKNAFGWDYSGSSNMHELNIVLAESIMIRRLKSEVLAQLPPKFRKLVILDGSHVRLSNGLKASHKAFNEANDHKLGSIEKRARMLEYFAETGKVKLPAITKYVEDLVESGKKFICFAHHKIVLNGICEYLDNAKCRYIRIDGSTASEDRKYVVEQFQSRDDIRVAVLSIVAANSGITLTAANLVLFTELYWNPGILTQAEDRAHRIGQQDSVSIEYLLAKGTVDDFLWPMIQTKLEVLNKAGLSKDNFQDAEARGYSTGKSGASSTSKQQFRLEDYFSLSQPNSDSASITTNSAPSPPKISKTMESSTIYDDMMTTDEDDQMLVAMLDESFGSI